jgi:hypothetical protein
MAQRIVTAALILLTQSSSGSAAESGFKYVTAGRDTRVFVVAGLGANCSSAVAPKIVLTVQPLQGVVTLQPGIPTTIQYSLSGRCIGSPARGIGVNYKANAEAVGKDRFSISVRMPTGELATRDFEIKITD